MPAYRFERSDGVEVELVMPMKEAPSIGSTIRIEGWEYRRLPPRPSDIVVNSDPYCGRYPYVTTQLPPDLKGEQYHDGGVIVKNREEEARLKSQYRLGTI